MTIHFTIENNWAVESHAQPRLRRARPIRGRMSEIDMMRMLTKSAS